MANRAKGEITLKVGDAEYTLCYNHDALIQMEDQLDQGVVAITNEMRRWAKEPERIRLKWIRVLVWAGLRKHHKMSFEQVDSLMEQAAAEETDLFEKVGDAMSKAFEGPETKAARPTNGGVTSGAGTESSQSSSPSDTPQSNSGTSLRESSR